MDFQEVVCSRSMVRRYDASRPIGPAAVDRLLGNAVRAPSAGHSQGWEFLVLDTKEHLDLFWEATSPAPDAKNAWLDGMRSAPLLVVPMSDEQIYRTRYAEPDKKGVQDWSVPYWHVDAGMASLLILLTAVDEGLGSCFFGIPGSRLKQFRDAFGIPERLVPVGAITIGYAHPDRGARGSARRGRREGVVHRGRYPS